jgi:glutathione S-transferase
MAINLYLASKYDKGLWPKSVEDQARAYQWSFWVMLEVEAELLTALWNLVLAPEDKRDPDRAAKSQQKLQGPLKVLDDALAGKSYLAGNSFTVADLNVAAVLSWTKGAGVDLAAFANLNRWFQDCFGRPARKAASKK